MLGSPREIEPEEIHSISILIKEVEEQPEFQNQKMSHFKTLLTRIRQNLDLFHNEDKKMEKEALFQLSADFRKIVEFKCDHPKHFFSTALT